MRSLGRPVLGRGKKIAYERINLNNCKRIDNDGAWVRKTRCKTQNYFNTQKQLKKPQRNMDRHLCHPCVSTRQQRADGEQLRLKPSEGLKWQPPKLLDGKKPNYSGYSLTAICRLKGVGEILVFHISHHGMDAPFHMPSNASTAMRWHHDSGNASKSQNPKRGAGSWTCRAASTFSPSWCCWCILKILGCCRRHLNEKEQDLCSNPRSLMSEVNEKWGLWCLQDKSHTSLKSHHQAPQSWNSGQKITMSLKPITRRWLFCVPSDSDEENRH